MLHDEAIHQRQEVCIINSIGSNLLQHWCALAFYEHPSRHNYFNFKKLMGACIHQLKILAVQLLAVHKL